MRTVCLIGSLLVTCVRLNAQDPVCDYEHAVNQPPSAYCSDTSSVRADSALQAVYRRALAATTHAAARAALVRSQQAWTAYLAAQRVLYAALPDRIRSNYAAALDIHQRRIFLQRALLGEWSELDERAAQAEMKSDLRSLIVAEETFFAESVKYTNQGSQLTLRLADQDTLLLLRLTQDGWVARIGSTRTKTICSIFVGSTPIPPAVTEGKPVCR